MAVTIDKLLGEPLLHTHSSEDLSDLTTLDDRYLRLQGGTLTGDLYFVDANTSVILKDSNGVSWRISVNTDGALVTSQTTSGTGIGLLLTLTKTD